MTAQEIEQADKFVEENVMYLYGGEYYAVNIMSTNLVDGIPCYYGVSDDGVYAYFEVDEIKAEFPHI